MRRHSKRKWIGIILSILVLVTIAVAVSISSVDNENVAENEAEKTKFLISRQYATENVENERLKLEERQFSESNIVDSSLNNKPSSNKIQSTNKDTMKETGTNSAPTHRHEWEAVTKTDKVKSQVPVYGDVCRSCGQDVTGIGDIHILEGNCTGYDTDVIISYKEITETVSYTVYECSCGATK